MEFDQGGSLAGASVLCELERFEEAAEMLRRLVEQDDSDPQAWSLLAYAELRAGAAERAADAAREAARRSPGAMLPCILACLALLRLGRPGEAVACARAAAEIDPTDWRALALLARALAALRESPDEARALVARAEVLEPREPEVRITAGLVSSAFGHPQEARAAFRAVLQLDPGNAVAQHELARLRLGKRVTDPAVLAEAAAGFARAIAADPELASKSQHSLDLLLRAFLSKASYLLFINAYVVGRLTEGSNTAIARLLPVVLLAVPGWYMLRFARHATPTVKRRTIAVLSGDRAVAVAAGFEAGAVLCILAASLLSSTLRTTFAGCAFVSALAARVVLYRQVERASATVRGAPHRPMLGSAAMWIIAAALALTAAFLVVAGAQGKANSAVFVVAAIPALGAALIVRVVLRRRGAA
jgi:Flp pilus assembly protein TadD